MSKKVTLSSFVYEDNSGAKRQLDLDGTKFRSREACGVWVVRDKAWKIFSSTGQYNRMVANYKNARDNNVPTPADSRFVQGSVTLAESRGGPQPGFAFVSKYITSGRSFALAKNTGSFKRVIDSIKNDDVLIKIDAALGAAQKIGLSDPQGFIDANNASNPIVFTDLHTHTEPSQQLGAMRTHISKQREKLQRKR